MTCECKEPGYCPRYAKVQGTRAHQICRGLVLTPEKCEAYRQNWARMASLQCVNLQNEMRRQECPSCNGNVQIKVFGCAVHGECTIGKPLEGVACCPCDDYRVMTASPCPEIL